MEFKGTKQELQNKISKAKRKIEKWEKELEQHNKPLNGWCVPEDKPFKISFFNNGKPIHGISICGKPFKYYNELHYKYRQATEQEIQERLFDSEQCRQYIGADYECLLGDGMVVGEFEYFLTADNSIWAVLSNGRPNKICDEHGNWAEIKQEPTTEEKVNEMWEYYKLIKK